MQNHMADHGRNHRQHLIQSTVDLMSARPGLSVDEQLLADILLRAEQDRHAAMSRFTLDSDEYQTADRRVQDVLILFRDRRAA